MAELEKWRERNHGAFPEEIFLQVDGGSENANQYVLAMLELIVSKRMARTILYSRLPTGHTHADIDACFAHIWKWMRDKPIETLSKYSIGIRDSFKLSKLKATVADVYVIPDYTSWLVDCIDSSMGQFAKQELTQHCWRFEAVEPSEYSSLVAKRLTAPTVRTKSLNSRRSLAVNVSLLLDRSLVWKRPQLT